MTTTVPTNQGATPCASADPELFQPFETQTDLVAAAKALCSRCPIRRSCLDYALTRRESGIWGGTTETERREILAGAPVRVAVRRAA